VQASKPCASHSAEAHLAAGLAAAGHELVELDPTGHQVGLWSTGGETDAVDPAGSVIYEASNADTTWPTASLRKYALP
jgi:hypothetical protein